jgi:uncharacterized membrane protein
MKENRPYQGYQGKNPRYNDENKEGRERQSGGRFNNNRRSHSILPPPHILQEYEKLSEGATERLLEMAEIEQAHRHDWEDDALRSYTKSHRIGQLFGFIIALAIVGVALYLAVNGYGQTAAVVAASGFLSLTINSLVTAKTRRFDRKPRKFNARTERTAEVKTDVVAEHSVS